MKLETLADADLVDRAAAHEPGNARTSR